MKRSLDYDVTLGSLCYVLLSVACRSVNSRPNNNIYILHLSKLADILIQTKSEKYVFKLIEFTHFAMGQRQWCKVVK